MDGGTAQPASATDYGSQAIDGASLVWDSQPRWRAGRTYELWQLHTRRALKAGVGKSGVAEVASPSYCGLPHAKIPGDRGGLRVEGDHDTGQMAPLRFEWLVDRGWLQCISGGSGGGSEINVRYDERCGAAACA